MNARCSGNREDPLLGRRPFPGTTRTDTKEGLITLFDRKRAKGAPTLTAPTMQSDLVTHGSYASAVNPQGCFFPLPQSGAGLERWYEVRLEGRMPELNGRPAAIVQIRPRDNLRFGHRIWVDEATAMPVRAEISDASGQVIERLQFTRLELRRDIPDAELQPGLDRRDFRWVRQAGRAPAQAPVWTVQQPPAGFRVSASAVQEMIGVPTPVDQLVLSDGLASVSVFIHATAPGQAPAVGASRAGTASSFSAVVQGHQVTAVGEVPPGTLKAIVSGVVQRSAGGER